MKTGIFAFLFSLLLAPLDAFANPYLPKPGEKTLSMRISTCAVSGGFVHLYTALDNGLFDKYGMKFENIFIRGSGPNLSALSGGGVTPLRRRRNGFPTAAGIDAKSSRLLWSTSLCVDYAKGSQAPEDLEENLWVSSRGGRARAVLARSRSGHRRQPGRALSGRGGG
jgi:hypothetical protein